MQLRPSRRAPLALGLAVALAALTQASFTNPYVPSFRGAPDTDFAYWESFQFGGGVPNAPSDPSSTNADATLEATNPGAFVTGGGNLYSFSDTPSFVVRDSAPADVLEVAMSVSTWGTELDYGGVVLRYTDESSVVYSLPPTLTTELANYPGMGVNVETLFEWDLSGVAADILAYEIAFECASTSMSLDAVVLDVRHQKPVEAYCTAKVNSAGCTPQIEWSGQPHANSGAPFMIGASSVLSQKAGQLFYGTTGRLAAPFKGGTLCVGSPVRRTPVQSSGGVAACDGQYAFDFNAFVASQQDPGLVVGAIVNAQYWSRDPAASYQAGLTNAIEFPLAP